MASSGGNAGVRWLWDSSRQLRYYIDYNRHEYVYENNRGRIPMPDSTETPRITRPTRDQSEPQASQEEYPSPSSHGNRGYNYQQRSSEDVVRDMAGLSMSGRSHERRAFRQRQREFFRRGRVFAFEPTAGSAATASTALSDLAVQSGFYADRPHSRVLRYVVIYPAKDGDDYCWVLPISSYGEKGVAEQTKQDHGIIYTGTTEQTQRETEAARRGERGMQPYALRVDRNLPTDKLHEMSRVNYRTALKFSHGSEVYDVGVVNRNDEWALEAQFLAVQKLYRKQKQPVPLAHRSTGNDGDEDDGDGASDDIAPDDDAQDPSSRARSDRYHAGSSKGKGKAPERQSQSGGSRQQQQLSNDKMAIEAKYTQDAWRRLKAKGQTDQQIITALAQALQEKTPTLEWVEAVAGVRGRLKYGQP